MKGFSTLMLLFLLPMILIILTVSITSFYWISTYTQKQKLCRHTLLSTQKTLAEGLNTILALNPQAQALRLKEKLLKIAIASTITNPPLLAELIAQLKINQQTQVALNLKMKAIQKNTEIKAQSVLLAKAKDFLNFPKAQLHLIKTPPLAIAPDFIPSPLFESKQHLGLSWKSKTTSFLSTYLNTEKPIHGACSTTLHRKDNLWRPTLSLP